VCSAKVPAALGDAHGVVFAAPCALLGAAGPHQHVRLRLLQEVECLIGLSAVFPPRNNMRWAPAFVAVLSVLAVGSATAQEGPNILTKKGTPRDQLALLVLNAAFQNIALSDGQKSRALDIVKRAQGQLEMLDARTPSDRQRMTDLTRKRNDDLESLLTTSADSLRFKENVKNGTQARLPGGKRLLQVPW
jgi:hypothetical protein